MLMDEAAHTKNILLDYSAEAGSPSKRFHVQSHDFEDSAAGSNEYLINTKPFRGDYQTFLDGNKLHIPKDYHDALEFGGVLTAAPPDRAEDGSLRYRLLLFGGMHWQWMVRNFARINGLEPSRIDLVRYVWGYQQHFTLDSDKTVTLDKKLIDYGGLKQRNEDKVVLIGLIYFAEVEAMASYTDHELRPQDVKALAHALAIQ